MTRSGKSETHASKKSRDALLREMEELRARLEEAEAIIEAVQSGGVDALIVSGPEGERVFALEGADYPYRVMVEVMNEGVVTLGADGGVLSCNTRFANFVKMPVEEIPGKPLARFVAKRDLRKLSAFLKRAAKRGGVMAIALARADGTSMSVNLSAAAFEVGASTALCVVVTDLTEAFTAAETRLRLASIVETSNDAVISESLDNIILTWNAAAERIFGFSAREAVGQPASLVVPRDRIQEVEMIAERIRRGERIEGYETVRITRSGAPIHVSMTVSPLMDPNGNIRGISIIARDIAELKKTEAELETYRHHLEDMVQQRTGELEAANAELQTRIIERTRIEETLQKNKERLQMALQAVNMATWDWHIPTGDILWNNEHYRMFGYEVGAVKPSYEAWASRVHSDDLETTEAAFRAAMNAGLAYSAKYRTRWADGTIHWLRAAGQFDRDAAGQVVRSYGVLLDITEEKETELRIQELNSALQEHVAAVEAVNKELESYSHSVSHDLRTPLRFVNRIAHMLLHEPGEHLSTGAVQQVNMILQATSEMATLIEKLLVFSQVTREPMKQRRVDLRRLFQEAVKELQQAEEDHSVEIVIQDLAPCQGDRTLLKEVAANLLANALKFTRHRDRARITVGCTETTAETVYFVQDNGVGFNMSDSDSLFVPFRRLHSQAEFEGTGIGLALVKRIIDRHGGRIWAASEVDKGATFYFTLGKEKAE